ncbi:MAG: Crp/Fnr family transcriptional regulator [Flavobacteriales bacterium]|nr:Crp/Fnr family transcriptional regulator [Flavobacteriales bacterium]
MQQLIDNVSKYVDITPEAWRDIESQFTLKKIKRGDFFVREGMICKHLGFIKQGIVRSYYLHKGEEITRFMLWENMWMTALSSFVTQESTHENIQAVTDCELLLISKSSNESLYERYIEWQKLGRLINQEYHIKLEKRLISLLSLNAEERYINLINEQPEILQKVPLQYIASYIGVTPVSLSRIRSKVVKSGKL